MDYLGLQAAVGDFLNRADLYAQIPTFIVLAEAKMNRRLRVRQMVTNAEANVTSEFETAPPDFLAPISIKRTDNTVLSSISPDAMAFQKMQGSGVPGCPRAYSVVGTSIEFSPAPDQAYLMYLVYYAQLPGLSATNLSNWLLSLAPDAYLYGALTQAAIHVKDGRAAAWGDLFEAAINEVDGMSNSDSYGARLEPMASNIV